MIVCNIQAASVLCLVNQTFLPEGPVRRQIPAFGCLFRQRNFYRSSRDILTCRKDPNGKAVNVPTFAWQQLCMMFYAFYTRWLKLFRMLQMGSRSILAVVAVVLVAGAAADINTIVGNFALNLVRSNSYAVALMQGC